MKKISLEDLQKVIDSIPTKKIELDNNSWGDVSIHYEEFIKPESVMFYVKEFIKNKEEHKQIKCSKCMDTGWISFTDFTGLHSSSYPCDCQYENIKPE